MLLTWVSLLGAGLLAHSRCLFNIWGGVGMREATSSTPAPCRAWETFPRNLSLILLPPSHRWHCVSERLTGKVGWKRVTNSSRLAACSAVLSALQTFPETWPL
uniref:Secreted protein n=1 Tax=Suricata suricatta TaxID=37032 RepID=A0A673SSM4_SURSU